MYVRKSRVVVKGEGLTVITDDLAWGSDAAYRTAGRQTAVRRVAATTLQSSDWRSETVQQ